MFVVKPSWRKLGKRTRVARRIEKAALETEGIGDIVVIYMPTSRANYWMVQNSEGIAGPWIPLGVKFEDSADMLPDFIETIELDSTVCPLTDEQMTDEEIIFESMLKALENHQKEISTYYATINLVSPLDFLNLTNTVPYETLVH